MAASTAGKADRSTDSAVRQQRKIQQRIDRKATPGKSFSGDRPVWTPLNPADQSASEVAKSGQDSDMGRPAQTEEIPPAYVFLASPVTASYPSGAFLPVNRGPHG